MSLEQAIDRLATAIEKLTVLAGTPAVSTAPPPTEQPKDTAKAKGKAAKTTAAEKANATEAEVVGKATQVAPDELLETKKYTDVDVRAALQGYAGTFAENGTKEARKLMVKLAGLSDPDTKLGDLPADKYEVVTEGAKKATAERKKAAAEAL